MRTTWWMSVLLAGVAAAAEVPEGAARYYEVLKKRPHQATLFDRFESGWLDERSGEELEAFLRERAEVEGGAGWTLLAKFHGRRGADGPALEALGKAIEALPEDGELRLERAAVRSRLLELDGAREDLEAARKSEDAELAGRAAKALGRLLMRSGKPEEAAAVWEETLAANPGDVDLLEDLVEAAAAEGDAVQALGFLEKLTAATGDPYRRALQGLRKGDLLVAAGRVDEALGAYDAVLGQVGGGSWLEREVLAQIEKLFRRDERVDDLRAHLGKLAEANAGRLAIHRQLARLEAAAGEMDAAVGRYREVLKRSPGERELREEFVRMLADGERLDEAVEELEKMIGQAPAEVGLWFQLAGLRHRQGKVEETGVALEKARELGGKGEAEELRVAALMLDYGLGESGEALLEELAARDGASEVAAETLASHLARTGRKAEAVEIFAKLAAEGGLEAVLRAQGGLAGLGEAERALAAMKARREEFAGEGRFVAAWLQAALAAEKATEAEGDALRLIRLAQGPAELGEAVGLAVQVVESAAATARWLDELRGVAERDAAQTFLLAALLERTGDLVGVEALLGAREEPEVVRFHAALLERRGELRRAVEAMSRLAATDEGRKASFLKELAELQQRSGMLAEALATTERWKQAAPGDRAAWLFRATLLEDRGELEEALREVRQAAAKFEGDEDLRVRLAGLHEGLGQGAEAEGIFWRLYDEAEGAPEQARWAAQLARLAGMTGRTAELEERLRERARTNRQAVGPVLALAEVARVRNDDEKLRDLLLEAVRLQPKDLDLRLQIAGLEQEAGEVERALAVLEEALPFDRDQRVRGALIQAYLRSGDLEKGLRQMRAMAGGRKLEVRQLETLALSLAEARLHEDAIAMLRREAPEDDWRLAWVLGTLLAEDGREREAVVAFERVLTAEEEKAGAAPVPSWMGFWSMPRELEPLFLVFEAWQNQNRGGSARSMRMVPPHLETAKALAVKSLLEMEKRLGGDEVGRVLERAKVEHVGILRDLANGMDVTAGGWDVVMERHGGTRAGVLIRLVFGQLDEDEVEAEDGARLAELTKDEALEPEVRIMAAAARFRMAGEDAAAKQAAAGDLLEVAASVEGDLGELWMPQVIAALVNVGGSATLPEEMRQRTLEVLDRMTAADARMRNLHGGSRLTVEKTLDPELDLAARINEEVRDHQERAVSGMGAFPLLDQVLRGRRAQGMSHAQVVQSLGMMAGNVFSPEALGLSSVPYWTIEFIGRDGSLESGGEWRDRMESPVLRLLRAIQVGDEAAIAKAMAVEVSGLEARDFVVLKLCHAWALEGAGAEAKFDALEAFREVASTDRLMAEVVDGEMMKVAEGLEGEALSERAEELTALLWRRRVSGGTAVMADLAEAAGRFGLDDLKERFEPKVVAAGVTNGALGAARLGGGSSSGRSGGGRTTRERVMELSAAGKHEVAAREAWALVRQLREQAWNAGEAADLVKRLNAETLAEMARQLDPGTSTSRVRRLDFADFCLLTGEDGKARELLEGMLAERSGDAEVAMRLAFAPGVEAERVRSLLAEAVGGGPEAMTILQQRVEAAMNGEAEPLLEMVERVTDFMEHLPTEGAEKMNLSWVGYAAAEFFGSRYEADLPSLLEDEEADEDVQRELIERREALARRLARAMAVSPVTSEAGFRLLRRWRDSGVAEEELDGMLGTALRWQLGASHAGPFALVIGNHWHSSGEDLEEGSSWEWLGRRLAAGIDPERLLPAAWLEEVEKTDAKMVKLLGRLKTARDLDAVGEFLEVLNEGGDGEAYAEVIAAMMVRARAMEGVEDFLIERMAELNEPQENMPPLPSSMTLAQSGLALAASAADGAKAQALIEASARAVLGESRDWKAASQTLVMRVFQWVDAVERAATAPAERLRLAGRVSAAGLPATQNGWRMEEGLRGTGRMSVSELREFAAEAGWLGGVEDWAAPEVLSVTYQMQGGRPDLELKREVMIEPWLEGLRDVSDEVEKAWREEVAKGRRTFGERVLTAALVEGRERSEEILKAFQENAGVIAKLSPEQGQRVAVLAAWLVPADREKLPASLRERFSEGQAEAGRESVVEAKARLKRLDRTSGGYGSESFEAVMDLLPKIAANSPEEAVEVFAEAEEIFTVRLAHGGRYSNYTSNGYEQAARDQAVGEWIEAMQESGLGVEQTVAVVKALDAHPVGRRLAWLPTNYGGWWTAAGAGLVRPMMEKLPSSGMNQKVVPAAVIREVEGASPEVQGAVLVSLIDRLGSRWGWVSKGLADGCLEELGDPEGKWWGPALRCFLGMVSWRELSGAERQEVVEAYREVLRNERLPVTLRVELAFELTPKRPEVVAEREVCDELAALFLRFLGEERSAAQRWAAVLLDYVSSCEQPAAADAASRKLVDAILGNLDRPLAAGHGKLPISFGKSAFLAAVATKSELAAGWFGRAKAECHGDYQILIRLAQSGAFDLAEEILPTEGFTVRCWSKTTVWTAALDRAVDAFLEEIRERHPEAALLVESESLYLQEVKPPAGPERGTRERARRVMERYFEMRPEDELVRQMVMRTIIRHFPTDERVMDEWIEWAKGESYEPHLRGRLADEPAPGPGYRGYELSVCKEENFHAAAIMAMTRGDVTLLREVLDAMTKVAAERPRGFEGIYERFVLRSTAVFGWALGAGKTEGFAAAAPVYRDFAAMAAKVNGFEEYPEVRVPLVIAETMAAWTGGLDEHRAFEKSADGRLKQALREKEKFPAMMPMVWNGKELFIWLQEPLEGERMAFAREFFTKPEAEELFSTDLGWTHRFRTTNFKPVIDHLAANPPERLHRAARAGLSLYAARMFQYGDKEKAAGKFREALEAAEGPEWAESRALIKFDFARFLNKKGEAAAALGMIETMPEDERKGRHEKQRGRLLEELKKAAGGGR